MMQPDLMLRDDQGTPLMATELKSRRGIDASWAARLRRNMLAHGYGHRAPLLMVATPEWIFVWREAPPPDLKERSPDFIGDARELLAERAVASGLSLHELDESSFEHLIASWLSIIAAAPSADDLPPATRDFVVGSGLFEARTGARVTAGPAV